MAGGRVKLGEVADAPESQSVGLEKYTQEIFIFFTLGFALASAASQSLGWYRFTAYSASMQKRRKKVGQIYDR